MDAQTVIESYVRDVTRRLPRRDQADVALELRALLGEELADRAAPAGRPADAAMAVDLLAGFGPPSQVALRYRPAPALIDPADTRGFLISAGVGIVVLGVLASLAATPPSKNALTTAILAWLGLLAVIFAGAAWARRHWPGFGRWKPRDPDVVSRAASVALIGVILLGVVAYGAPGWVMEQFTGDGRPAPWLARLAYTTDFQATRLPWLLALWGGQGLLCAWVAAEGRWRPLTRRLEAGLALAVAAVLAWFLFAGAMFQTPAVEHTVRVWLAVITLGLFAEAVLKTRRIVRLPPRQGPSGLAA